MENLLDYIAAKTGTVYLSDLRTNPASRKQIRYVLEAIPDNKFSLAEWTEALRYIIGDNSISPSTEQKARALLKNT